MPVIASGGAAGPADFVAAVRDGGADAVLAASIFHRRIHSIAAVKAAIDAGQTAGSRVGEVVAVHVIARPHVNVDDVMPLGRAGHGKSE